MVQKLTSRKFWTAVSGIIIGCLMLFGFSESTLEKISALILILGDTVAYIWTEGNVDANNKKGEQENDE